MENAVEIIAAATAMLVVVGTLFAAIYQAKGNTEKTLKEHIDRIEKKYEELEKKYEELRVKYDELLIAQTKPVRKRKAQR